MREYNITVSGNGRIVIPVIFRKELNINPGDEVILSLSPEKDIIVHSPRQSLQKLQGLFAAKQKEDLVDELTQMRRNEEI